MAEPGRTREDEFYVGYLPLARGQRRWLLMVLPLAVGALLMGVVVIAAAQRIPGRGVWDTGKPVVREGVLRASPYPMVVMDDPEALPRFLVEVGKRGAQRRAGVLDGRRVRVTGWPLRRDGREILELVPDGTALVAVSDGPGATGWTLTGERLGAARLSGEIVDYKCYLGAMKPGDGKAHKACAMLCIGNGIPPMLVTTGADGSPRYLLLVDGARGAVGARVVELAGEPVEVWGEVERVGRLEVMVVEGVERRSGEATERRRGAE